MERQLLCQTVKTWDEINAILISPVRPEYQWFVTSFLEGCRDNGYEPQDTSRVFSLEINMLLDAMLRPARQGRALWSAESMKAQLKTMLTQWARLRTWPQLRISVEQPLEPTLEFFVTNKHVWEAAREKWIEESEAKTLALLQKWETDRNGGSAIAGG